MQQHPETISSGLQTLLVDFSEIIRGSLSTDSAQLDQARQQIRALQTMLEVHGICLGQTLEQVPNQLHHLCSLKNSTPALQQTIEKLQRFADQLDQIAVSSQQDFGDNIVALVSCY